MYRDNEYCAFLAVMLLDSIFASTNTFGKM